MSDQHAMKMKASAWIMEAMAMHGWRHSETQIDDGHVAIKFVCDEMPSEETRRHVTQHCARRVGHKATLVFIEEHRKTEVSEPPPKLIDLAHRWEAGDFVGNDPTMKRFRDAFDAARMNHSSFAEFVIRVHEEATR